MGVAVVAALVLTIAIVGAAAVGFGLAALFVWFDEKFLD